MENNQTNTYMEETNLELVHTYNRFPVVLDHGEGVIFMIQKERSIWILRQELRYVDLDTVMKSIRLH